MKLTDSEIIQKYGHPPDIEAFTPSSLDEYSRTSTRSGLVWEMGMVFVVVTNSKGERFALSRGWQMSSSVLWMTTQLDPDITKPSPRVFRNQFSGPITFDLDEDQQTAKIKSWPSKHSFKVDIEVGGKIHWEEENGALNLDFKPLGPAMRWTDLGNGDYEGMIVTSQMCEVKGTLNGEEVSGLGGLDQDWLPPGIGFTQCKIYTHIENTWIPWITRYDDGSIEYGKNASGKGDWCWGFYVKDGTAILGKSNSIDTKMGDAGGVDIPLEADIQYGDHKFKWVVDGRVDVVQGNLNWVSGKMINTAKAAKPVETFAWHEFRAPKK